MILRTVIFVCGLLSCCLVGAQQRELLWDGNMPNSRGMNITDSIDNGRMRRVGEPHFYVFAPPAEQNKGVGIIICPPGGYGHHTYDIAGFQLAKWFNTMGVTAFVLLSRLPASPDLIERETGSVMDVQRMMKIVRTRAAEWGLDGSRIGVMGCSAGGHLAAMLSTYPEDLACVGDRFDGASVRPDFAVLVSPVITMGAKAHAGSRRNLLGDGASDDKLALYSAELGVTGLAPVTLLFHAADDGVVPVENSVMYFSALHSLGVEASLHVFPYGGHNIGLLDNPGSTGMWMGICGAWLREMGVIK